MTIISVVSAKFSFRFLNISHSSSNTDIVEIERFDFDGALINATMIIKRPVKDLMVNFS